MSKWEFAPCCVTCPMSLVCMGYPDEYRMGCYMREDHVLAIVNVELGDMLWRRVDRDCPRGEYEYQKARMPYDEHERE